MEALEQIQIDLDPEIASILAEHEASRPDIIADQVTDRAEALYMFRGELYTANEIRVKCPYLQNMGEAAFNATTASYRVEVAARPESIDSPGLTKPEAVTAIEVKHAENQLQIREKVTEEIAEPDVLQAVHVQEIVEQIEQEVRVNESQVHEKIELPTSGEQPNTVELPEPVVLSEISEPVLETTPLIIEMLAENEPTPDTANVITTEPVSTVESEITVTEDVSKIDLMLLAEADPEVAQAFEMVLEHVGTEIVIEEHDEPRLPEMVITAKEQYLSEATPEQAVVVEALSILVEAACDRLATLAEANQLDEVEAVEIEKLITDWYGQLLTELGIEHDEETIKEFIALIKKQSIAQEANPKFLSEVADEDENYDQGTHEKKNFIAQFLAGNLSEDHELFTQHWWAGRLAVGGL